MSAGLSAGKRAGMANASEKSRAARPTDGISALLSAGIWGRTRLAVLGLLIFAAFAFGGGSRADITSLIVLRPLSFVLLALALLNLGRRDWARLGVPGWLALALVVLAIAQLVPLPPAIWTALPERELAAQIAATAKLAEQWHPLSLAPSRTLNTVFALGVPLAALALLAGLAASQHRKVIWLIVAVGMVSSLVGLAQLMGPAGGPLYFYRITNPDVAVGLFANRNHHAVFLASLVPLLGYLGFCAWHGRADGRRSVIIIALAGASLFLLPLVLVTGSRAGAALALALALIMAALVWFSVRKRADALAQAGAQSGAQSGRAPRMARGVIAPLMLAGIAGIAAITHFASRSLSIERLLDSGMDAGLRAELLPHLAAMARDHFPVGTGLGAFRRAWEVVEPRELLRPQYLNQAHNDVLQFLIEGGLVALVLMVLAVIWFVRSGVHAWRAFFASAQRGEPFGMALFTWLALAALLAGSLFDYPLRTPSLMALAALLAGLTQLSLRTAHDDAPAKRNPAR